MADGGNGIDHAKRFEQIVNHQAAEFENPEPEPEAEVITTPEFELEKVLDGSRFAKSGGEFIKYLDLIIEGAEFSARKNIDSHALFAYSSGVVDTYKHIRNRIRTWRGDKL